VKPFLLFHLTSLPLYPNGFSRIRFPVNLNTTNFRKSGKLVAFIEKEMKGLCINDEDFKAGKWLEKISQLLNLPCIQRPNRNGSYQAAGMIRDILKREKN